MQGLDSTQDRGQRLQGHPNHVVVGLLRRQGAPRSLGMKAEPAGVLILGREALFHDPRPQAAGRSEFGDLLQKIHVHVKEEGETGSKLINCQPFAQHCFHVCDAVGQGEGYLLDRRTACLAHVVAADADGIPAGHVLLAKRDDVGGDPQGRLGRVNVRTPGHVLLEKVVLQSSLQLSGFHSLALGHRNHHAEQCGGRSVNRHRDADLVQRNLVQQNLHVLQGRDGHPDPSHFSPGHGMIGVVSHLSRKIKGHGQSRLSLGEQIAVALVRFLRAGKARILAHGPQAAPVHRGLYTAGVRRLSWEAQVLKVIQLGDGFGSVEPPDRNARRG